MISVRIKFGVLIKFLDYSGQEMDVDPIQCPICYDNVPDVVLQCGHLFHGSCVDKYTTSCFKGWDVGDGIYDCHLTFDPVCPVCRNKNVEKFPIGDGLQKAIQKQVDDNFLINIKRIAFTRAGNAAEWSPVSGETDWSKVTRVKLHC